MKRDDDLIRNLLFEAEETDEASIIVDFDSDTGEFDEKRHHHAQLLLDAGYFAEVGEYCYRLTNDGHDYLISIKDESVWNNTRNVANRMGGVALPLMKDIAISLVKRSIKDKFGLDL